MSSETKQITAIASNPNRRSILLGSTTLAVTTMLGSNRPIEPARAEQSASAGGAKPNILVIMGDDIGWSNIGAYNQGLMAGQSNTGKTPGNGLSGGVGQMR